MGVFPEGQADNPKDQAENLILNANKFIDFIRSLPDLFFLKKINDWSPRDITAHLIGWNLYTIDGSKQMSRGETPSYFIDPGEDFSKVNAVLVKEHDLTDKAELIQQLETSAEKLKQFILSLDPTVWETDYGVIYKGEQITIRNSIDGLISDYDDHRQQIEDWTKNVGGKF